MPVRVYLETSFISACVTDRTDPGSVYRRDTSLFARRTGSAADRHSGSGEVLGMSPIFPVDFGDWAQMRTPDSRVLSGALPAG